VCRTIVGLPAGIYAASSNNCFQGESLEQFILHYFVRRRPLKTGCCQLTMRCWTAFSGQFPHKPSKTASRRRMKFLRVRDLHLHSGGRVRIRAHGGVPMRATLQPHALWRTGKTGEGWAVGIYPWNLIGPVQFKHRPHMPSDRARSQNRANLHRAPYSRDALHSFAIEALPKEGTLTRRPYLYMCIRCKWMFRVNDRLGSIVALDKSGRPLSEPENSRRIATFERGPCPALRHLTNRRLTQAQSAGWLGHLLFATKNWLSEAWRRWGRNGKGLFPPDSHPTAVIKPDDMLH